ncbi:hypothetical protein [Pseudovibrio sp. SPO723]|uniref:hypothetical protein n=1 Tax=Nesiotobacter zosterae TaxID=392721 RepID=UPI0029C4E71D|nr:hypothetical protein [Pseudovibrio sp. SPO723]MDX5595685.1 hypothetical protein [Pseudovibrio sp. SPO723]
MKTATLLALLFLNGELPENFRTVGEAAITADGVPATITRAERIDGENSGIGGEHISQVVSDNGKLLGYVRMTKEMAQPAKLPDQETAHAVAMEVLREHAPELLEAHKVHWIAPHDETITVMENGERKTLTLTGMKVKMRATTSDKLWFWVIVGPNEQVMVFERDIYWITIPGRRRTEKWLHDSWLAEHPDVVAALEKDANS